MWQQPSPCAGCTGMITGTLQPSGTLGSTGLTRQRSHKLATQPVPIKSSVRSKLLPGGRLTCTAFGTAEESLSDAEGPSCTLSPLGQGIEQWPEGSTAGSSELEADVQQDTLLQEETTEGQAAACAWPRAAPVEFVEKRSTVRPAADWFALGLTTDRVSTVLVNHPLLADAELAAQFSPAVAYLQELGLPQPAICSIVSRVPQVLELASGTEIGTAEMQTGRPLQLHMVVEYLRGLQISSPDICTVVRDVPAVLTYDVATVLHPHAKQLRSLGIPTSTLGAAVTAWPQLLDVALLPRLQYLRALGTQPNALQSALQHLPQLTATQSPVLLRLPAEVLLSYNAASSPVAAVGLAPVLGRSHHVGCGLHPVAAFLLQIGIREALVAQAVRDHPEVMTGSLQQCAAYLWKSGAKAADIGAFLAAAPQLLAHPYLLPRLHFLQRIGVVGTAAITLLQAGAPLMQRSVEQQQQVVDALCAVGVPPGHISRVVMLCPSVLSLDAAGELAPALECLWELGLSGSAFARMVVLSPRLLASELRPQVTFLRSTGMSSNDVAKVVTECPLVLSRDVATQLAPVATWLAAVGVPADRIAAVLAANPKVLAYNADRDLRPQAAFLVALGIAEADLAAMLVQSPRLLSLSLRPQLRYLCKQGVPAAQLGLILKQFPQMVPVVFDGIAKPLREWLTATGVSRQALTHMLLVTPSVAGYGTHPRALLRLPLAEGEAEGGPSWRAADIALPPASRPAGTQGVGQHVQPQVTYLLKMGVSWRVIGKIATFCPEVLDAAAFPELQRMVGALAGWGAGVGVPGEDLGRLVKWLPRFITLSSAEWQAALTALQGFGLESYHLGRVIRAAPQACFVGAQQLQVLGHWLQGLGLERERVALMALRHPALLAHPLTDMHATLEALHAWGLDDQDVCELVTRCPLVLTLPLQRARYATKVHFLQQVIGLAPNEVLPQHPLFLIYNLKVRTGPRTAFLRRLGRPLPLLAAYLSCSDAEFCSEFAGCQPHTYEEFRERWSAEEGAAWGGPE